MWGRNEGVVWGMQSGLLDPGVGSGYRGLSAGAGGLLSWGHLSFHVSAAIWSLCCHGHTDPLPPPSPNLDALPFSQCPPHATRVPETQFQMSGGVPQFGHRRGPASVWAAAAGWGTPRWAGSELFDRAVLPPSSPLCRIHSNKDRAGPPAGCFLERQLLFSAASVCLALEEQCLNQVLASTSKSGEVTCPPPGPPDHSDPQGPQLEVGRAGGERTLGSQGYSCLWSCDAETQEPPDSAGY